MNHGSAPSVLDPNLRVGLRILIADDFPEWRTQIRKVLCSKPEWEIICEACDGLEAVQKSVELRPDIVVLDVGMPVMNGLRAGVKIRESCPGSHIIFVTHTLDHLVMEAAMDMGASGYVLKTNVSAELVPVIAAALDDQKEQNSRRSPARS